MLIDAFLTTLYIYTLQPLQHQLSGRLQIRVSSWFILHIDETVTLRDMNRFTADVLVSYRARQI